MGEGLGQSPQGVAAEVLGVACAQGVQGRGAPWPEGCVQGGSGKRWAEGEGRWCRWRAGPWPHLTSRPQSSPTPEAASTPELPPETQETPGPALCR